jgi:hypothetical protein
MRDRKEPDRFKTAFWLGGLLSVADPFGLFVSDMPPDSSSTPWIIGACTQFVIGGMIFHYLIVGLKKLFRALKKEP